MNLIQRCISIFLTFVMLLASTAWAQQADGQSYAKPSSLPDSPGVQASNQTAQLESPQQAATSTQTTTPQSSQQFQSAQQQKPLGTAVAEVPPPSGVAVSNSAGAAIAPAKQRRVRTIVIGVGVLLAAGIAVGTVAALTGASPSRPPGSH